MARPVTPTLTEGELRLMKVLWQRGPSTAREVVDALAREDVKLAESSVRTVLGILREKGYVAVDRKGRSHLYRPLVSQVEARQRALQHVVQRFFDGSREELVLTLIRNESLGSGDLARIRRIVLEDI